MKQRYMGILPASVLLLGVCWWSRGAAVIERPADAARVSQQPVEWMEADMQAAATVLRLRLEHEHVQVNTQGFCHYNIVFHAVVEECVLGNIPVGARVQVEAADNFSLWPRRPDELEQARRLMQEQKGGEAVLLLQPFVTDDGIAGREARQICGRVIFSLQKASTATSFAAFITAGSVPPCRNALYAIPKLGYLAKSGAANSNLPNVRKSSLSNLPSTRSG